MSDMSKIITIEPNMEYARAYPIHKKETGIYSKKELFSAIKRTLRLAKKFLPPKTIFEIRAERSEEKLPIVDDNGKRIPPSSHIAWYCRKKLPHYLTNKIRFNKNIYNPIFCGRFKT